MPNLVNPFLFTAPSGGAISLVNSATIISTSDNNNANVPYTSSNYTPASNSNVLVFFIHGYNALGSSTASVASITWGGVDISASQVVFQTAITRAWSAVYVITNPGDIAKALVLDSSVDSRAMAADVLEFSGVNTTTPVVSNSSISGPTTTSASHSFTVSDAGNVIVGALSVDGGAAGPFTPDSGTVEQTDGTTGSVTFNDNSYSSFYKLPGATGAQTIGSSWVVSRPYTGTGVELAVA